MNTTYFHQWYNNTNSKSFFLKERFGESRWSSSHMSVKRGMMRSGSTFAVLLLSPYTRAAGLLRCRPMVVARIVGSPSHDPLRPPFAIMIASA